MIKQKIISIVIILFLFGQGNSDSVSCKAIDQLTDQDIWYTYFIVRTLFSFSVFDTYFIFAIGTLSIVLTVLALLTWIPHTTFVMPADIVFIVLMASLVGNLSQLIQASKLNLIQSTMYKMKVHLPQIHFNKFAVVLDSLVCQEIQFHFTIMHFSVFHQPIPFIIHFENLF